MENIGRYIHQLRVNKGHHLKDVADYLNIEPEVLMNVEKEATELTKNQVLKLAGYFGADETEILIAYQKQRIHNESIDISGNSVRKSCLVKIRMWR